MHFCNVHFTTSEVILFNFTYNFRKISRTRGSNEGVFFNTFPEYFTQECSRILLKYIFSKLEILSVRCPREFRIRYFEVLVWMKINNSSKNPFNFRESLVVRATNNRKPFPKGGNLSGRATIFQKEIRRRSTLRTWRRISCNSSPCFPRLTPTLRFPRAREIGAATPRGIT